MKMRVVISMLRGVNVGGHRKVRMSELLAIYKQMGLQDARSFIQSGNVLFRVPDAELERLADGIELAIEERLGFRPNVILRTLEEMRALVAGSPFAGRSEMEPSKLLVTFLAKTPEAAGCSEAMRIAVGPEELRITGREMFIYFPMGMGQSKLPMARIDKALGKCGTGRNWNSVMKMLAIAEEMAR